MKTPYSKDYNPPAPILPVSLAAPEEAPQIGPLMALVDTGADGTFIPTAFLEQLDAPIEYTTNVRTHIGERLRRVFIHQIDLLINSIRLPNVEVISDDWGSEIIIGRNVLNKLELLLDGPQQITRLE
jgi:predicted aspartyl protease